MGCASIERDMQLGVEKPSLRSRLPEWVKSPWPLKSHYDPENHHPTALVAHCTGSNTETQRFQVLALEAPNIQFPSKECQLVGFGLVWLVFSGQELSILHIFLLVSIHSLRAILDLGWHI